MGLFGGDDEHYRRCHDEYQAGPHHEASLGHETAAAGVAFMAAREYEKHQEANGKPANHALALEVLAGITGFVVDREVETKGMDAWDKRQLKKQAQEHVEREYREYHDYRD